MDNNKPTRQPLTLAELVDQAIATVYVHDVQRERSIFPAIHYQSN